MNLDKKYYDEVGAHDILYMVKNHPEWAANRIQQGEKAEIVLENIQRLLTDMKFRYSDN